MVFLLTHDRAFGYNFAEGGYNNRGLIGDKNPFYKKVPTKAVAASVAARTGKHLSEEHKEKIKQGNIKAGLKENSINALIQYNKTHKRHLYGSKNHKSQSVRCIETGIIYESQRIAEHEMNLPRGSIHNALKMNIRAKGYHFERVLNSDGQSKDVGSSEPKRRDA